MAERSNVLVFPEGGNNGSNGIDPTLLFALNNGGGFGNMNPFWMMFMLPFIYPFFGSMMGGNGWFGNWGGGMNNGAGFISNQLNNDAGRDLILQAINGRADALGQLAGILNTSVENVKNGIYALNTDLVTMDGNNKLTGAQIINAIQSGNTALGQQLAQCCCENRLATCQQTNTLSSQLASHNADVRLQLAQNEASDQLAVCQQTNALTSQAASNTNNILGAIQAQNAMITKEFCDLKERELQNKINTQGDIITQLRNQISNDHQTLQFNAAFHALDDKIDAIAAKQPNTVPVTWPNLVAANATPYVGGYGYGGYGGWGNNGVIL